MISGYLGMSAQAIAVIILAPCLAMPPSSASRPTMKPDTSAMNGSGMPRLQHRSMKCAAFIAHSENSTPTTRSRVMRMASLSFSVTMQGRPEMSPTPVMMPPAGRARPGGEPRSAPPLRAFGKRP